jgi:phosphoglycerate kinase
MREISAIPSIDEAEFSDKRVLLRVDINSPIDRESGRIVNDNRIVKSIPTIRDLLDKGARLTIIAHQGDTTDYPSLINLSEHAERLSALLGQSVQFVEDIAGPAAIEKIAKLGKGQALLLDNIRYLTEEASTFEDSVKQTPAEMGSCYMIRRLAPMFDCYVNDAFAAAHRNSPSMVGFQELMPAYAGRLLMQELNALQAITKNPARPCIYMLGGARAGDAFGMIEQVLNDGSADKLLLSGLLGQIFMLADDINIGRSSAGFIRHKGFEQYIPRARDYLKSHRSKIFYPKDVAVASHGARINLSPNDVADDQDIADIGDQTISEYQAIIAAANTIFVNGPCGIYENELFALGTKSLWNSVADAQGFSVIGGGDSVTSFNAFTDITKLNYVSTAGGALIRYLSGVDLPLLESFERAQH